MLISVITSNEYGKVQEIRYAHDNSKKVTEAIRFTFNGTGGVTGRWKAEDYDDPVATMIQAAGELPEWTDFRTVEKYKDYFEAGLDTLFIQENDAYNGPNAQGLLNLKETMSKAKQAGISKVIVCDRRFTNASRLTHSILDAPANDDELLLYKQFFNVWNSSVNRTHTKDEVISAVKAILKEYIAVENFHGVMLSDEPNYLNIAYYGELYGYIEQAFLLAKQELEAQGERVYVDKIFIQACLLPSGFVDIDKTEFVPSERFTQLITLCGGDKYKAHQAAFKEYVQTFFANSGASQIMIDTYAISHDRNSATIDSEHPYYVSRYHFSSLVEIAEQAKANGADIGGIALSTELLSWQGNVYRPIPNQAFMYYQLNSYMMFGAKSIGYHTYWAKTGGEAYLHPDGTSFIGRDGEKTELYPMFQQLNAETLLLAKFMQNYSYNSYKVFTNGSASNYLDIISEGQANSFSKLISATINSGKEALITELKNEKHDGKFIYAVMNTEIVDFPDDNVVTGNDVTVTLNLSDVGDQVSVFFDGQESKLAVTNGSLTLTIPAGHAYYVIVE